MTNRKPHLFGSCSVLLFLAAAVAPCYGQSDNAVSSRRVVPAQEVINLSDQVVQSEEPARVTPEIVARPARNTLLQPLKRPPAKSQPLMSQPIKSPLVKSQPIKSPPAKIPLAKIPTVKSKPVKSSPKTTAPPAKKFPKLADPEHFRVKNKGANSKWISLQDKQDPSQGSVLANQKAQDDEIPLLSRLPVSDLNQGILSNPMQRAYNKPDIPDPNMLLVDNGQLSPLFASDLQPSSKNWQSPNMVHRPLYFEEANLERYGNGIGRCQPFKSGVHFFGSMILLPYKLGAVPPTKCDYSLGHFRPGDCVPAYKKEIDFSIRGAIYEGLAIGTILGGL